VSVSLEIKGAPEVQKVMSACPAALAQGMQNALNRALQRYRTYHAQQRLQKPPPPVWRGRSGPEGVHATRKAGKGLLGAWHVDVNGKTLMGMYGKLWTRHMIAKEFEAGEFLVSSKSGWAPLPPARDRLGRTIKKYAAMRQARKLIIVKRKDGKKFLVMENKAWKRHRGQARKAGYTLRPQAGQRFTFLFHQVKNKIIQARLGFHALFNGWLAREGRGIFFKALTGATRAAQRRLGGPA
jgi:hypothetical protein